MSQAVTSEVAGVQPAGTRNKLRTQGTQREKLLTVLRIAAQYETWVTLAELAVKTRFPPASISAQLRHLRKAEYGGWRVEKRRREWETEGLVWEYRLAEGRNEVTK